jgi:hypothetical protein
MFKVVFAAKLIYFFKECFSYLNIIYGVKPPKTYFFLMLMVYFLPVDDGRNLSYCLSILVGNVKIGFSMFKSRVFVLVKALPARRLL